MSRPRRHHPALHLLGFVSLLVAGAMVCALVLLTLGSVARELGGGRVVWMIVAALAIVATWACARLLVLRLNRRR